MRSPASLSERRIDLLGVVRAKPAAEHDEARDVLRQRAQLRKARLERRRQPIAEWETSRTRGGRRRRARRSMSALRETLRMKPATMPMKARSVREFDGVAANQSALPRMNTPASGRRGATARELAQAQRSRGDEVRGAGRGRKLGIAPRQRMRHGAKIAEIELELRLRGAQQMPVGIAEPRTRERDSSLAQSHSRLLHAASRKRPSRSRSSRGRLRRGIGGTDAIAAFMRVASAHRGIGKASLDRSRIRLRARCSRRRARLGGEPKARGDEQGHAPQGARLRLDAGRRLGAHPLLFDWAS